MARPKRMKILCSEVGPVCDERIISGEGVYPPSAHHPAGEISWKGGEIVYMLPDLAESYVAANKAEYAEEEQPAIETAMLETPPEAEVLKPPSLKTIRTLRKRSELQKTEA